MPDMQVTIKNLKIALAMLDAESKRSSSAVEKNELKCAYSLLSERLVTLIMNQHSPKKDLKPKGK